MQAALILFAAMVAISKLMEGSSGEWEMGDKKSSPPSKRSGRKGSQSDAGNATNAHRTPYKSGKKATLGFVETPDGLRHSSRKGKRPVRLEPAG